MQDMEIRISRWVEEHRDSYIRDVSRLVAIRSVSGEAEEGKPFGPGPAAALEEAMKICREKGFRVTNHDGYVMTADLCAQECALDILAHLDVVGEGEGWDTDPYTATEKDGCLYGRGTDDDKGPAVAAIYAMACVAEQFPLYLIRKKAALQPGFPRHGRNKTAFPGSVPWMEVTGSTSCLRMQKRRFWDFLRRRLKRSAALWRSSWAFGSAQFKVKPASKSR